MKFSSFVVGAALSSSVIAFPGMAGNKKMMDFHKGLTRRALTPNLKPRGEQPYPPGLNNATNVGVAKEIRDCLDGTIACEIPASSYSAPDLGSSACAADTCCVWDWVVKDLVKDFVQSDGQCSPLARQAIRLGFHDAAAWSLTSGFGGADGSMLTTDEITRIENNGMQAIVAYGQVALLKWKPFSVGAADLVQMMATVATVSCPLGPRVLSFVGRKDGFSSPTGLLPSALSDADTLIDLFADKTISADDLAALVGAHSTSNQFFVNTSMPNAPQDDTPGVWDVDFYVNTLDANANPAIYKFPSDVNLSLDPRTSGAFQAFANAGFGQAAWNDAFARAYVRVSILGVNNIDKLTDCTKVIPASNSVIPANAKIPSAGSSPSASASVSVKASGSGKPDVSASGKGGAKASSFSKGGDVSTTTTSAVGWPSDKPHSGLPISTITFFSFSTHTVTLSGGKTSCSVETIPVTSTLWADELLSTVTDYTYVAPTTTAAASSVAACVIKTVTTTVTVW